MVGGEGGRRGVSARSASDGAQRCTVPSIGCPNPPLDLQNNNQLTMATGEEVKEGKGQAGEEGRDGGGKGVRAMKCNDGLPHNCVVPLPRRP